MTHLELLMKMLEKYETLKEDTTSLYDEEFYEGCIYALDEAIQYLKGIKEFKEDLKMTDKEIIKKLMEKTKQAILSEDDGYIEYKNPCYGANIAFEFDEDGSLIDVIS